MTIGTTFVLGPDLPGATFGSYASHDASEQSSWRTEYRNAAELAKEAAFYQALQAVVIAGIQAAAADNAADKQYDIANRQMTIAEEEYARYKDKFICNEHKMADEACEVTVPVEDYQTRAARATADVRKQFGMARGKLNRTRSRYCLADFSRSLCSLEAAEARAIAAAKDAAYRYEEQHVRALDDLRFNRAAQVFGLGRGIFNGQSGTYANAMGLASGSIATRLGGINNFLGAVSGGVSGYIQANLASQIAPSPFVGVYSRGGPGMATSNGYTQNFGGPMPLGAPAESSTPTRSF